MITGQYLPFFHSCGAVSKEIQIQPPLLSAALQTQIKCMIKRMVCFGKSKIINIYSELPSSPPFAAFFALFSPFFLLSEGF